MGTLTYSKPSNHPVHVGFALSRGTSSGGGRPVKGDDKSHSGGCFLKGNATIATTATPTTPAQATCSACEIIQQIRKTASLVAQLILRFSSTLGSLTGLSQSQTDTLKDLVTKLVAEHTRTCIIHFCCLVLGCKVPFGVELYMEPLIRCRA